MSQNEMKKNVAQKALERITPHLQKNSVLGIGTGSTTNYFIDLLAQHKYKFDGCVASSKATEERLHKHQIMTYDLNNFISLDFYIDSADEANHHLQLIKGGGGALTREKIVAAVSKEFICIIDDSKLVDTLGKFPLPIEVIPISRSYVARQLVQLGGDPAYRYGTTTDNGNVILDVWNLDITNPILLEKEINQIPGVVANGLFANRSADVLITGSKKEIRTIFTKK